MSNFNFDELAEALSSSKEMKTKTKERKEDDDDERERIEEFSTDDTVQYAREW